MSEFILKVDGMFQWCIPDGVSDSSKNVAGTLEIATNGVSTLSLVGLLPSGKDAGLGFDFSPIDPEQCIVGVLKDSRYVVLRRLESAGTNLNNVLSHQKYKARDAIVFNNLEELPGLDAVTKLFVGLDALDDWAAEPAVIVEKTPDGPTARTFKPETQSFKLPNKTVRLKTNIRHTVSDIWFQSVTIKQETFWEVEPDAPCSLALVRKEFHLLEDLLLLLADVDVELPWPTVKYGTESGLYYFERRRSDSQKVEIIKSWVTLSRLTASLGALLFNLEAQQDILGPGLYLYLGVRRSPALYLENKFSTAIFGLESLHRRVGTSVTQAKLEEKISRIIGDVKLSDDRRWLSGRLKNAGEPSLEERLFLTFSEIEIGLDPKTLRVFCKECADLRNQVAHFGGQRDGGYEVFIDRMYKLNDAVRPLYHAVLLNRIGLDPERLAAYFHKSPYARQRKNTLEAAGLSFVPPSFPPTKVERQPEPEK
ncbi:HEPN domain-containing protein [Massilia timonae]|uniref:ApeA N-terminal domain 1-containing protein n=1 Tax=Massilia timonae TaxID=47229 RepID=UPI0028D11AE0|nr:HEPN domain-containing protein [Massilia timonae]